MRMRVEPKSLGTEHKWWGDLPGEEDRKEVPGGERRRQPAEQLPERLVASTSLTGTASLGCMESPQMNRTDIPALDKICSCRRKKI